MENFTDYSLIRLCLLTTVYTQRSYAWQGLYASYASTYKLTMEVIVVKT